VVVLGDANPDPVLSGGDVEPSFGQAEHLVEGAQLTVGGSGAILACAVAKLGLRVALCGVVGDDLFGRFMCEEVARRGVDVKGLVVDADLPTGLTVVLELLDATDVFFPNEMEATRIARISDVPEAIHRLHAHARIVVVKEGAGGAFDAGFLAAFLAGSMQEVEAALEGGLGA
jgi:ribokinase